jgi:hypothetical protein
VVIDKFQQQPRELRAKQIDYGQFLVEDELDAEVPLVVEVMRICGNTDDTDSPFEISFATVASPTRVTYMAGGGASGNTYKVTFLVDTTGGQRHESEIIFAIKEI